MMAKRTFRSPAVAARVLAVQRTNVAKARAEGKMNRRGAPNGWTRGEAEDARRNSWTNAERLLPVIAPGTRHPVTWEAEMAAEALLRVLALALDPTVPTRVRLTATRTVLEYTMPPPAGRKSWQGQVSLEWLEKLTHAAEGASAATNNVAEGASSKNKTPV